MQFSSVALACAKMTHCGLVRYLRCLDSLNPSRPGEPIGVHVYHCWIRLLITAVHAYYIRSSSGYHVRMAIMSEWTGLKTLNGF